MKFMLWQLAGTRFPAAAGAKAGYWLLRNHMINGEGGRIAEENRIDYVLDMTETTGTVWLGLDLQLLPLPRPQVRRLKKRDYYSCSRSSSNSR